MTDAPEMSFFWSAWITVIVLGSIFGCWWLLWVTRKSQKHDLETEETMGHAFDGIEEYDNPLPKWWMYMFLITIVFGLVYLVLYPGLGNFQGLLGWTQEKQWQAEVDRANEKHGPLYAKLAAMSADELLADDKALKMGQRLYATNCAVCHGSAARGNPGFPNLTDEDWLYGGDFDTIKTTIIGGRNAFMPAWQDVLGDTGIKQVAHYVRQLSGQETVDADLAEQGKEIFAANCAACHGPDGTGFMAMGAPNLTDGIWLYGGTQEIVELTLRAGRFGQMPAFADSLGEEKVHLVSAYVYSLTNKN